MAWHSAVNDISGNHIRCQNDVDRSAVLFCRDELRTPSPLLPPWHRPEPCDSAAMDEDCNDDFYFHSSENLGCNLQQPDVKAVNYGSLNGNHVVPLESLDNHYLQRVNLEMPDSCGSGSRFTRTDKILDRRPPAGSQFSKNRRLVIDRSKWTLHCTLHTFIIIIIVVVNIFKVAWIMKLW